MNIYEKAFQEHGSERKAAEALGISRSKFSSMLFLSKGICPYCRKVEVKNPKSRCEPCLKRADTRSPEEACMKKRKKSFVDLDQPGSNNNPILQEIKRHGHFPPTDKPIGWDGEGFRKIFPTKDLPFQIVEEVSFTDSSKCESRLIWGDNLAVLRSLPDESVNLIYLDPPFFSGRNYNLIFGDEDEERTFRDIWDGGLQTYLAWLNARLYELKRLMKPSGSIYVHLDWHAVHYVKTELDKIFGSENFLNEIVWSYNTRTMPTKWYARKHDTILFYVKDRNRFTFNLDDIRIGYKEDSLKQYNKVDENGRRYKPQSNGQRTYLNDKGQPCPSVWDIQILGSRDTERIGYPTQKPEKLLERIIRASTNVGDVVVDAFCGGGTTATVAQKLGRKWISCDISRVAIQVASDRIRNIKSGVGIEIPDERIARKAHHSIEYHGTYIKSLLKEYTSAEFNDFVCKCYESELYIKGKHIHATKGNYALFIGQPDAEITHTQVLAFYSEMKEKGFRYGQLIGWKISPKAKDEIERILNSTRKGEIRDIQAVTIKMGDIDSDEFKGANIEFVINPRATSATNQFQKTSLGACKKLGKD